MKQRKKPISKVSWGLNWPYTIVAKKKIHLGVLAILVIVFVFIIKVSNITLTKIELAKNGDVAKGYIYDSIKVGGKGTVEFRYTYKVGAIILKGSISNGDFRANDLIEVLYDKARPEKNWPLKEIAKEYPERLNTNKFYLQYKKKNAA